MRRNWIPYYMLVAALVLGALMFATPTRAASTITVTTTGDVIASDGLCSLREAIIAANMDSAFSDCPAGSGADRIEFSSELPAPATIVLTNSGAGENSALTGDLDITGTLTVSGAGTGQAILDGDDADRVFQVLPGARVTISDVTIRNGNPGVADDGGGIAIDLTGVLTVTNSTVISNTALTGGGIKVLGRLTAKDSSIEANRGGGISNDGGRLDLSNVQIANNTRGYGIRNQNWASLTFEGGQVSNNQGGGIYNTTSSATLRNLTIANNTNGGGVHNSGGTLTRLTMNQCLVISNTAASGGGIFNEGVGAVANIYDTRISGNAATASGGGVFNNGSMTLNSSTVDHNQARSGGGIEHFGGTLRLTNDTLSNNSASDNGGGLYNEGSAILKNVTLSLNTASDPENGGNIFNDNAQLSIGNSIVAHAGAAGNCGTNDGFLNSLGHNLDDDNTCGFGATGDIVNADPLLGPLQDNGGHTPTHALLPGSPAIDAGDCSNGTVTEDQRGLPRPQGAACDIGAYEVGATIDLSISKTRQGSGVVVAGGRITYTLTISNAGPTTPVTAIVVDTWTPSYAVVGVDASNCAVDFGMGVVTCTHTNLGVGSALLPAPYLVFTTSEAFSGVLTNTASVSPAGGIGDRNPVDNVSDPVVVTVTTGGGYSFYLPLILR